MQFSLHSVSQKLGLGLAAFAENSSEAEMVAYGLEIFLGSVWGEPLRPIPTFSYITQIWKEFR